jgi:hypothetical protein
MRQSPLNNNNICYNKPGILLKLEKIKKLKLTINKLLIIILIIRIVEWKHWNLFVNILLKMGMNFICYKLFRKLNHFMDNKNISNILKILSKKLIKIAKIG